ncbi:group II intron reverse transcriptase/maturase [Salinisphaera hydrothermalis]|uniref:group II intron reverse transcriptase/maturase n=1 Tax=Salinisphaera hydrothermalis TaxID=563188 RepID=UPI0033469638
MNTSAPPLMSTDSAEARVRAIQAKLHHWAQEDPDRCFDDLHNLVHDPAFLHVAWRQVKGNQGARTAGVDGQTACRIEDANAFLLRLRADLKVRTFNPLPVRERLIPKPGSAKYRRLGIPTLRDRVVQGALKLVLEPIFEADFQPCSYGFRPNRRAQDAIAEIHHLTSSCYEWVVEGDIKACFDEIDHAALMDRVRQRIGDKRVLALVKAFCKAGLLTEAGDHNATDSGTPQGGLLSPLLANIALSPLDNHFVQAWQAMGQHGGARQARRRKGLPTYRLVRYADDFVILVAGTREQAEALCGNAATVLAPMGLRLSPDKTTVAYIDEGFDFLGFRIQRRRKRGNQRRYVYTWPSRQALDSVKSRIRALTRMGRHLPLDVLLYRLNPVLRGWTNYFRHGVSKRTFGYLRAFVWRRVVCWLRRKHPRLNWKQLRGRYLPDWWPTADEVALSNPGAVSVTRYRYRGQQIPTPWAE